MNTIPKTELCTFRKVLTKKGDIMKKVLIVLMAFAMSLSLCSCGFGDKAPAIMAKFFPSVAEEMISEFCEDLTAPSAPLAKTSFDVRENTLICRFDYTRNLTSADIEKIKTETEKLPSVLFEMMIAMREKCPVIENYIYEYYDISGALFHSVEASEEEYLTACESIKDIADEMFEKSQEKENLLFFSIESRGTALVLKSTQDYLENPTEEEIEKLKEYAYGNDRIFYAQTYNRYREYTPFLRAIIVEYYDKNGEFLCDLTVGADDPETLVVAYGETLNEEYGEEDVFIYGTDRCIHHSYKLAPSVTRESIPSYPFDDYIRDSYNDNVETLEGLKEECPEIDSYVVDIVYANGDLAYSTAVGFSKEKTHPDVEAYRSANAEYVAQNASSETFSCTLSAFKRSLVYDYKYRDLTDATPEQKETLVKTLEANRAAAEKAVDIIKSECPMIESIFYTYYETDGDVIATMEIE